MFKENKYEYKMLLPALTEHYPGEMGLGHAHSRWMGFSTGQSGDPEVWVRSTKLRVLGTKGGGCPVLHAFLSFEKPQNSLSGPMMAKWI